MKQSRDFVNRQAPLSRLIATEEEHAALIKRGFKTNYKIVRDYNEDGDSSIAVEFGCYDSGDINDQANAVGRFSIVGLPPPRGTRVWVLSGPENYMVDDVFITPEDFRAAALNMINRAFVKRPNLDEIERTTLYYLIADYDSPFQKGGHREDKQGNITSPREIAIQGIELLIETGEIETKDGDRFMFTEYRLP